MYHSLKVFLSSVQRYLEAHLSVKGFDENVTLFPIGQYVIFHKCLKHQLTKEFAKYGLKSLSASSNICTNCNVSAISNQAKCLYSQLAVSIPAKVSVQSVISTLLAKVSLQLAVDNICAYYTDDEIMIRCLVINACYKECVCMCAHAQGMCVCIHDVCMYT